MELLHALLAQFTALGVAVVFFFSGLLASYTTQDIPVSIVPKISTTTTVSVATQASSSPKTTLPVVKAKPLTPTPSKSTVSSSSAASIQTPPTAPITSIDSTLLNTQTRSALVNILCLTQTGVHPISASGVFVDSRGVILTNAHVGQFFLLKDYPFSGNVDCVVRTGSPAQPLYHATLLYLPPAWVTANASQLVAQQAMGTGEDDYAFLLLTGTTDPNGTLPSSFPALPMTAQEPELGANTLLAAYPAGFLDGITIEKNLFITSAYAVVKQLFTFATGNNVDLVSIGGTIVSQGGSSGGAVVRASDGKLEGIIATDTSADTTAERDLRAITLAHINRSLITYGKGGIVDLLSQDLKAEAAAFNKDVAPGEKAQLVQVLPH